MKKSDSHFFNVNSLLQIEITTSEVSKMIKRVIYDYIPSLSDGREVWGETYKECEVGVNGVKEIKYFRSDWVGDLAEVQVTYDDGTKLIIFNPHTLFCTAD